MMSKDRRRAGLAAFVALASVLGAGAARATDAPFAGGIGAGIDHTKRLPIEAAQGQVSAAAAIDLLKRPAAQPLPTNRSSQGLAPTRIGGLRGMDSRGGVDAALSGPPPAPSGARWAPARRAGSAAPYVRFSEYERVLGVSFKIQPPQRAPEAASPGL
jgi:hypothetical protein